MDEMQASALFAQLVAGLLYLHTQGVMHRDLSLSNVLLTSCAALPNGGPRQQFAVKIADFGLAVQLSADDACATTMCGTPNYISPEIVAREKPYGLASDLWSLGCLLFSLLSGEAPFESNTIDTTLARVGRADYSFPSSISPTARDLISRLLQKNPEDRIDLLRAFLQAAPPAAHSMPSASGAC